MDKVISWEIKPWATPQTQMFTALRRFNERHRYSRLEQTNTQRQPQYGPGRFCL